MADFIPNADDALATWLATFKTKLAGYATKYGISNDDLTLYQSQCDNLIAAIHEVNAKKTELKNKVTVKDDLKTDVVGNIRSLANRIKSSTDYTSADGVDLAIITTATSMDSATAKPTLTISTTGGHIVIKFDKQKSNGVKIYGKRGSESTFTLLAIDTHSPYHDNRPNIAEGTPETRQYYAFYINAEDEQFGLQSDVVSITQ